jgi:hypothetical protein
MRAVLEQKVKTMGKKRVTRRRFLAASGAAATACGMSAFGAARKDAGKLAILGGTPVHRGGWQRWPVWDAGDEDELLAAVRSGTWCRLGGTNVSNFEWKYAELLGVKRCVCTVNGTNALSTALHVLDVGVGDEVITSPYTFIATYNVILGACALPVFADTDPETFQIDPKTIETRIAEHTRAILPVHILGLPADMDQVNAIARNAILKVYENRGRLV